MPALLTLVMVPPPFDPHPKQLRGAAGQLFETPEANHHAGMQPFAVGPLIRGVGSAEWRLGWLSDRPGPPGWPPPAVTFGPTACRVLARHREWSPFARLAADGPVRRAVMRVLTPMFFSRNGRDLPLPDPVLIAQNLLLRWNALAPAELEIDDAVKRALLDGVYLAGMVGTTAHLPVGPRLRQAGFVGDVELRLTRATSSAAAQTFGALTRFASIAGIGAMTTHGFGAVEVQPITPRRG